MSYHPQSLASEALLGLLVGDASGVPYEFFDPEEVPVGPLLMPSVPPAHRSHASAPMHAWSDDGSQALVLLDHLITYQDVQLPVFAKALMAWADTGAWAVQGQVFDIGSQTIVAFSRLRQGVAPAQSGGQDEFDNGNGSLMRVLPLALWHQGPDEDLIDLACRQSVPTHAHLRSQVCCAWYALWARALRRGAQIEAGWKQAHATLEIWAAGHPDRKREMAKVQAWEGRPVQGTGYVVDTLWSVRHALCTGTDVQSCIEVAIGLGNDTDTTAACVGGLAVLAHGLGSLPRAAIDALPLEPAVMEICAKLDAHALQERPRPGLRSP